MTLKLNDKYLQSFVNESDLLSIAPEVKAAHDLLSSRTGAGNDFLGWLDLPVNYDREEAQRIVKAAKKIQDTCDIFIVIGIGGSYLGARAAIEFCASPSYNDLCKNTPKIYLPVSPSLSASSVTNPCAPAATVRTSLNSPKK